MRMMQRASSSSSGGGGGSTEAEARASAVENHCFIIIFAFAIISSHHQTSTVISMYSYLFKKVFGLGVSLFPSHSQSSPPFINAAATERTRQRAASFSINAASHR